ncbi:MAG: acetylxylan esterase [Verrucomicrobiales bacterium]|nr:acetylxylan esterase [Verrucomicrobiales bacterium]
MNAPDNQSPSSVLRIARLVIAIAATAGLPVGALAQSTPGSSSQWNVFPTAPLTDIPSTLPNSPTLIKSLGDAAEYVLRWEPPVNAKAWRRRRPEVERAFRKAIGLEKLPERTPLNVRVVARHDFGDYSVENVIFESRPGFPVTANLYRPKPPAKGKRPAILCPIGHYLTPGKTADDVQTRCIKLTQLGFVVLVYDAIGQGERMFPGNIHHDAGYALLPLGETIAGWMVWDSIRAIDYLLTLEDVDPQRIGVTGNSGGGLNTLFTAALDDRVRAAVVVGFTFEFNNWLKYAGAHCTCTHLPGMFRGMEWFEIAGLIAPRAVMMLQGENDGIFPISGARRAGHNTEVIYSLLRQPGRARFVELPGQPHAYSRPYRERMYGWMARWLLGNGHGEPFAEGDVQPLPELDARLLCDAEGSVMAKAPTVVDLTTERALQAIGKLRAGGSNEARQSVRRWVADLTAPPDSQPHFLAPNARGKTPVPGGSLEKISFASEDGQRIPGLLWLPGPATTPAQTIVIVDDRGKSAVAESGLVQPLMESGFAVLSVDVRGRGETLGRYGPRYDTNFRLVANQTLFGQPLAGRRAFDLTRALDCLSLRKEMRTNAVTVVGIGDDVLPVLLAAATDPRIQQVAVARYVHSFVSQMRARTPPARDKMAEAWNDPQLNGRVNCGDYEVDFGSVIPFALEHADVPDIAALLAPRRLLFCQARDNGAPDAELVRSRFRRVVESTGNNRTQYAADHSLDAAVLLDWLRIENKP